MNIVWFISLDLKITLNKLSTNNNSILTCPYEKFERDITKFQPESGDNAKYWALIEQDKTRQTLSRVSRLSLTFVRLILQPKHSKTGRDKANLT